MELGTNLAEPLEHHTIIRCRAYGQHGDRPERCKEKESQL